MPNAIDYRRSVPESAWLRSPMARRPQATHRPMVPDDYLHGYDTRLEGRVRLWSPRRGVSRVPLLTPIAERPKLRCRRALLDDPLPASTLRFSAIYCPPVYGPGIWPNMPFVVQQEHLEHFAVLASHPPHYINVTVTMNDDRVFQLRDYALPIFREAFANGKLL